MQISNANLVHNDFESRIPDSFIAKKHEESKSPLKPNDKIQSPSISDQEEDYEESFKEESLKEEVIEEAESKFEVSPSQPSKQQTIKSE